MEKYLIIPRYIGGTEIEAVDEDDAMMEFAFDMDMDMNTYFKAVTEEEYVDRMAEIIIMNSKVANKVHELVIKNFISDELCNNYEILKNNREYLNTVADMAYEIYASGKGYTEYEALEEAYESWFEENIFNKGIDIDEKESDNYKMLIELKTNIPKEFQSDLPFEYLAFELPDGRHMSLTAQEYMSWDLNEDGNLTCEICDVGCLIDNCENEDDDEDDYRDFTKDDYKLLCNEDVELYEIGFYWYGKDDDSCGEINVFSAKVDIKKDNDEMSLYLNIQKEIDVIVYN